jgi:uncharacterized protein
MKIDIFDLIHGHAEFLNIDGFLDGDVIRVDDVQPLSPIHVKGMMTRAEDELLLNLTATVTIEQACSRCTRFFQAELVVTFKDDVALTQELKNKSEPLDITELIRDNILVQLPMKPLCSEDCKGLCPVCGSDRNEIDCTCESEQLDPRLSVLSNLLNEDE